MGYGLEVSSGVADAGVAHIIDTDNSFTSGTLLSVRNNTSTKCSVDFEGSVVCHDIAVGGALTVAETTVITGDLTAANAAGPAIVNEAATITNPTLIPNKADPDTGVGWQATDALSLIAGGVEGIRITEAGGSITVGITDDVAITGALDVTGATTFDDMVKSSSATAGVGYATGAGGTVAQGSGSGKATGVTLNTVCGEITMDGASLAGNNAVVSFECTNSAAAGGDVVVVNHPHVGTIGAYVVTADSDAGHIHFHVTNITHGSLSEAIVLRFAIIKAVTS